MEDRLHAFHGLCWYFHLPLKQWGLGKCGLVSLERCEGKDVGRVPGMCESGDQALSSLSFGIPDPS